MKTRREKDVETVYQFIRETPFPKGTRAKAAKALAAFDRLLVVYSRSLVENANDQA